MTTYLTVSNAERVALGFFYADPAGWAAGDLESLEALTQAFDLLELAKLGLGPQGWTQPADFVLEACVNVELPPAAAALLVRAWPSRPVPPPLGPAKLSLLRKLAEHAKGAP
jgi:hypothetical protein